MAHARLVIILVGAALLAALSGCQTPASRVQAAAESDAVPPDFSIAAAVLTPQGVRTANLPRDRRPGRYVMEADWVLRARHNARLSDDSYPGRTRQLSQAEVRGLWDELRRSGLLDADHPASVGKYLQPLEEVDRTVYLVYWSCNGTRRTLAIDADTEFSPAARRIADRMAELAWAAP